MRRAKAQREDRTRDLLRLELNDDTRVTVKQTS